ncbi:MAG: right-handed parallel beta-helix repeat-containing protein, partial [Myxococcota bacterium]|nr:right-handed parallel beta-helix repeat-containing protein [Myxococcota bacterium]
IADTELDASGGWGCGIWVQNDGELVATDSVVEGNRNNGIGIILGSATLERVQVLDTQPNEAGSGGNGIVVTAEGSLVATDCLVQGNTQTGLTVSWASSAVLDQVDILDTHRNALGTFAMGLNVQRQGRLTATDLTIRDTQGPGMTASTGQLECTHCTLSDNAVAGIMAHAGARLVIEDSIIESTVPGSNAGSGLGVYVSDQGLGGRDTDPHWVRPECSERIPCAKLPAAPPSLTLLDSTVRDNVMGALFIDGSGSHRIEGNTLSGGAGLSAAAGQWSHGDAVFVTRGVQDPVAWDEEEQEGLLLQDNSFTDGAGAGIFLDGVTATLSGNTYEGNDTDLVRQGCDLSDSPEGLDDEALTSTEQCPDYDYFAQDPTYSYYISEPEASN